MTSYRSVSCRLGAALFGLGFGSLSWGTVTVESLLREYADLGRLGRLAEPWYTTAQASSYDRASVAPGSDSWFGNDDAGQFVRTEVFGGRTEHVMADLRGPGAVVRFWSANPTGVLRFRFDGEREPRWTVPMAELLTGRHPRLGSPFAYISAQGANLYFPIPYEKSLLITVDESGGGFPKVYYQINHRTYTSGTAVRSFDPSWLESGQAHLDRVRSELESAWRSPSRPGSGNVEKRAVLLSGQRSEMAVEQGPGAVVEFSLRVLSLQAPDDPIAAPWNHPGQWNRVLRHLRLVGEFDGRRTIDVPVADFFVATAGPASGPAPYRTLAMEVRPDGRMVCRLVMPFARSARLTLHNQGLTPIRLEGTLKTSRWRWDSRSLHLHAQWLTDRVPSRPFRDLNVLETQGHGHFVGFGLHVANPTGAWWGEGDEKVYVDGESFPSMFGTGTEDYFGFAWCSPETFSRPFHAQPHVDGPSNYGHSSMVRWHVLDPIPFRRHLRFDIEAWHAMDITFELGRTAFWYARPGSDGPAPIDRRLLAMTDLRPPAPEPGQVEGEDLKVLSVSGGTLGPQDWAGLSAGRQLWWRFPRVGDTLVVEMDVPESGRYELVGDFGHNVDYGKFTVSVGGKPAPAPIDFFFGLLKWERRSLGTWTFEKGPVAIEFRSEGARDGAVPGNMLGIDTLILRRRT